MSHNLYSINNRYSFAYTGAMAWHGLGQALDPNATLEEWLQAAGFDFEILGSPVTYTDSNGVEHTFPARQALFRSDTGAAISIMSDGYKVVQPDAVMRFFEDLCSDRGWSLETAGVLGTGGKYWSLAKASETAEHNGSIHNLYLLLATSADGTLATTVQGTDVRVVCQNTLEMSLESKKTGKPIKVRHSSIFDSDKIKRELDLIDLDRSWADFQSKLSSLESVRVSPEEATAFFSELLRPETKAKPRGEHRAQSFADLLGSSVGGAYRGPVKTQDKERAIRGLAELQSSYVSAPGAAPGTAYGLVQGVTHWVDHARGIDADKRLNSAFWGQGQKLKTMALGKALELAS